MFKFQYKIKRRFLEFDVTLLRIIILISIYTWQMSMQYAENAISPDLIIFTIFNLTDHSD